MIPKRLLFQLLGRDSEPVVVTFLSGPEPLALAMLSEIRQLLPDREHYAVYDGQFPQVPGVTLLSLEQHRKVLRDKRVGLAPVLFTRRAGWEALHRAAVRLAPHKILAYNERLERYHLKLSSPISSFLFLAGVPLDRIHLRPKWLFPNRRDRSVFPTEHRTFQGRPVSVIRPRVAVLTPYFPYPLSHGGAVRIFHMLAEAAKDFDIFLFSFTDSLESTDPGPLTALCAQINVVPNTRYREPRWASLNPPEVGEFHSSTMVELLEKAKREQAIQLLQVEYTHMASYGGDILVEHDVTFDLQRQVHARRKSITSWWNLWRWTRYECRALRRYRSVVVMSEKDAALLQATNVQVIPNGVDLSRFRPLPEPSGARLLFVGSFRHFPNIVAYRYLTERVWPLLRQAEPDVRLTVVAGPDPDLHWKTHAGSATPYFDDRIERHSFVADVKPLYDAANLVVVPTEESAGTNLKVLEALAMERAVVSTSSGCAGLGLEHGVNVWIADTPEAFAQGILHLLCDHELRRAIALAGRVHAENHFDWTRLGVLQRQLWNELLPKQDLRIRRARSEDLNSIQAIQLASGLAAQWEPGSYFAYDVLIAEYHGEPAGFLVSRTLGHGEVEVLTIAVHEHLRRLGVATQLIAAVSANEIFLEVRESNGAARNLYRKMKFQELGIRKDYYEDPTENAVIMRLSRKLNRVNF